MAFDPVTWNSVSASQCPPPIRTRESEALETVTGEPALSVGAAVLRLAAAWLITSLGGAARLRILRIDFYRPEAGGRSKHHLRHFGVQDPFAPDGDQFRCRHPMPEHNRLVVFSSVKA